MAIPFGLKKLKKPEAEMLRKMAEERFDFFNVAFLDTVLQDFHKQWFQFQFENIRTLVLGPRASWKCADVNSLVPTLDGLSYLHELSPLPSSDLLYTEKIETTVSSCLGATQANQIFCSGFDRAVEIETEDGFSLKCSPEHRLFSWNDHLLKFREASDLKPGDQVVFRGQWASFSNDINPFEVPPDLWFAALAFFYATYPNRWGIIWRQQKMRRQLAAPLWKFFGHTDWGTLPSQLKTFLDDNSFGSFFLPRPLRFCSYHSAKVLARMFWWYNRHVKFTEDQAKEVQTWFLNLGLPLKRVGVTLLHKSPDLRQHFYEQLKTEDDTFLHHKYSSQQIENLADLTLLELCNSAFVPPIVKLHAKEKFLKRKNNFQGRTKKAAEFVSDFLDFAPNLKRYAFMFRSPFFLQQIKDIKKCSCTMMDLTTKEGNYIIDGVIGHNSTILDRHYAIWRALRDPNIRIGIISKSSLLSSSFVSQIKHVLESNDRIRAIWPHLIQPDKAPKWNNNEVTLIREKSHAEATFTAMGVGTTLAGRHFDILLFDDVVDTDCQASPILRKRIWDWFRFVAMQTLSVAEYTQAHIIGTLYHVEDLYHKVLQFEKENKGGWKTLIQPAIKPDGTSFWEESFPLKELQSIEATYGTDVFRLQYQNDPDFGGSGLVNWEDLESCYYEPSSDTELENLDLVMGVDLASPGTDKQSFHSSFATVVVGMNYTNKKTYVLDILKRKNLRMSDQRDIIVDRYQLFPNISSIQIEAFAVQGYFHDYLAECPIALPIYKVMTPGSKESRHEFILMLLQNSRLFLRRDFHRELIEEIVNFPNTSADLLDALFMAIKGARREPTIRFLNL
jgi:hypothetical protein